MPVVKDSKTTCPAKNIKQEERYEKKNRFYEQNNTCKINKKNLYMEMER